MATEREQSLLFAAETAEALRRGWRPPDLNVPIARREDEMAFAAVPVTVEQFTGADVPYSQGVFLAAGGWGTLAASAIGSAIWNASERRAAERTAAPQWRPVDAGELYVTSWRLAARLRGSFMEVAYWDVQSAALDPHGLILWVAGWPTTRLCVAHPEWLGVVYSWLGHGVVPELPLTDEQRSTVEGRLRGL